jgi:hypothetical protein
MSRSIWMAVEVLVGLAFLAAILMYAITTLKGA